MVEESLSPSGFRRRFLGKGSGSFKLNQPNMDAVFCPMATGHLYIWVCLSLVLKGSQEDIHNFAGSPEKSQTHIVV